VATPDRGGYSTVRAFWTSTDAGTTASSVIVDLVLLPPTSIALSLGLSLIPDEQQAYTRAPAAAATTRTGSVVTSHRQLILLTTLSRHRYRYHQQQQVLTVYSAINLSGVHTNPCRATQFTVLSAEIQQINIANPLPGGAGRPKFNQLEMITTCTYRPSLVKINARIFELSW